MMHVPLGDTYYLKFTTRRFSTGAPFTLAGTPAVSVYEEANLTQITAGITLTADYDSVTGLNDVAIVATGANGYEAGKYYSVVITTGTVDSISVVGEVVGHFRIVPAEDAGAGIPDVNVTHFGDTAATTASGRPEVNTTHISGTAQTANDVGQDVNDILTDTADMQPKLGTVTDLGGGATLGANNSDMAGATFSTTTDSQEAIRDRGDAAWTTGASGSDRLLMVDTTIATLASQTSFTLTAGSADDDAYNNCTIVIEDASTSTQKAVGLVSDYTGSTKTVTLKYDPAVFTMATTDKVYILAENSLKTTVANRQLDVTAGGAAGIDWANVENPTTAVDLSGTDIQLCDTVTTNTDMRGTDSAALASVCTEARLSELDAATAGKMANQVDEIRTDTGEIGTAGAGLTDLGGMSTTMKAEVNAEADTAISDAALATAASISALNNISAADVNAQVVDVLKTDTMTQSTLCPQEAPPVNATIEEAIAYLYKAWRNKSTQTSTTYSLFADGGSIVDHKATVSDDGTTATKGEVATGP